MSRRFPHYTDPKIAEAIGKARQSTGWPDGMALADMAAHILAGDGDDALLDHASKQVQDYLARETVEGS